MRINPKTPIVDYDGKPWMQLEQDGTETQVTLKHLIFMALNTPIPQEPWNADSRMRIFDICVKITGTDAAELDEGERALILERADKLGNSFAPLSYARLKVMVQDEKAKAAPEAKRKPKAEAAVVERSDNGTEPAVAAV